MQMRYGKKQATRPGSPDDVYSPVGDALDRPAWMRDRALLPKVPVDRLVRAQQQQQRGSQR